MQADAVRAYVQAKLTGVPTWVRIPREMWPKSWANMRDPVCPLVLALYGHPDAGTCWEKHCDGKLREAGFLPIINWAGCYRHSKLRGVLSVYVDDFKLACHADDEKKIWKLLQGRIKLEDPTMLKQYLGCTHVHHGGDLGQEVKVPVANPRVQRGGQEQGKAQGEGHRVQHVLIHRTVC